MGNATTCVRCHLLREILETPDYLCADCDWKDIQARSEANKKTHFRTFWILVLMYSLVIAIIAYRIWKHIP